MKSKEIVARARAAVGTRFRPQGRSLERGLDCIGVAAMAMGCPEAKVRHDYGLRFSDRDEFSRQIDKCGLLRIVPAAAGEGDLLLVQAGPAQLHVVILTDLGYLHADARLRTVVEVPAPVPWPALSAWRHPEHEGALKGGFGEPH